MNRRVSDELLAREVVARLHESPEEFDVALAVVLFEIAHAVAMFLIAVLREQGVDARASDDGKPSDRHSFAEARHEMSVARHDDERTFLFVADGERDARRARIQVDAIEKKAHRLVVTIKREREAHLIVRDAIEP